MSNIDGSKLGTSGDGGDPIAKYSASQPRDDQGQWTSGGGSGGGRRTRGSDSRASSTFDGFRSRMNDGQKKLLSEAQDWDDDKLSDELNLASHGVRIASRDKDAKRLTEYSDRADVLGFEASRRFDAS